MTISLLNMMGRKSVLEPKRISSPGAASAIAARREPSPESAVEVTVMVAAKRRGSVNKLHRELSSTRFR